jgi:HPt (histidine-containing phosphotransfer) domain-containing protein
MDDAASCTRSQPRLLLDAVDGDVTVFRGLAPLFFQETVDRYADIVRFSAAGRFADMGQEAHALKGTAVAVGASELVGVLQRIEHAGLRERVACDAGELARLGALLQLARDDMNAFIGALRPDGLMPG